MICKENATIIRALNKYGRVPQSHELLDEIENLQQELQRKDNIINELKEWVEDKEERDCSDCLCYSFVLDKINELEGDNK